MFSLLYLLGALIIFAATRLIVQAMAYIGGDGLWFFAIVLGVFTILTGISSLILAWYIGRKKKAAFALGLLLSLLIASFTFPDVLSFFQSGDISIGSNTIFVFAVLSIIQITTTWKLSGKQASNLADLENKKVPSVD